MTFQLASVAWEAIEQLRLRIAGARYGSIADSAQGFADIFVEHFPSIVLARVFLVVPLERLPPVDQQFAGTFVNRDPRLHASTRVLSLVGSNGHAARYMGRRNSKGHLAIPLMDRQFVQSIPMVAKLLADLEVDFQALDDGRPIATRRMLGGHNSTFYVGNASEARDATGRSIIPAQDFVHAHRIATVFGMGGAYVDGTLAVAIIFTQEQLDRAAVDRFASFISTFKISTADMLLAGNIYLPNELAQ